MKALSLFSGIGGIDLACEWAGIETVAFCEREPFPQKVLRKHWPNVPIYDDVCTLTKERLEQDAVITSGRSIDIIHGGYPCQPFSNAGKRKGKADERNLWPEMFRIIREINPSWVIGENVVGHVTMGLDEVLSDLESFGYQAQSFIIPASSIGAPHKRERVFTVAYSSGSGQQRQREPFKPSSAKEDIFGKTSESNNVPIVGECSSESRMDRVFHGISRGLDGHRFPALFGQEQFGWEPPRVKKGVKQRKERLTALGNAVVPQQIYPIIKIIADIQKTLD